MSYIYLQEQGEVSSLSSLSGMMSKLSEGLI